MIMLLVKRPHINSIIRKLLFVVLVVLSFSKGITPLYAQMLVTDTAAAQQRAAQWKTDVANFGKQFAEISKGTSATLQVLQSSQNLLQQNTQYFTGNLGLNSFLKEALINYLTQYGSLTVALPTRRVGNTLLDNKKAKDVKGLLRQVFSTKDDRRRAAYEPLRRKYHSDSLMSALQLSEIVINNVEENLDRISNSASSADTSNNIKEALDVNNSLLVQVVASLNQTNQLLAHLVRIQSAKDFRGEYDSAEKLERTHAEQVRTSISNPENNIFSINTDKLPYKERGKQTTVEKVFGGQR